MKIANNSVRQTQQHATSRRNSLSKTERKKEKEFRNLRRQRKGMWQAI